MVSEIKDERKLTKSMIPPSSRTSTQLMTSISNIYKKYESYTREGKEAGTKPSFRKKSWKELKEELMSEFNQSQHQPKTLITEYDSRPSTNRTETKTP